VHVKIISATAKYDIIEALRFRVSYSKGALTRHSWIHYTDCWIV